jgi:Domain of unknown function (DUF4965)/Domain of unknown function (DUF5127)/Domain of unknown function (DUF1793)/Domain of unknown function (DUF4964)
MLNRKPLLLLILVPLLTANTFAQQPIYRPPAVPLVVHNPFLSIWSCADHLTDDVTRHWTKHPHSLTSIIRVDGQSYRLMGNQPADLPAMPQTNVRVLPTRTIYEFEQSPLHVTLTFVTPALPDDVDVLSRPLTYVTWAVKSLDGKPHAVSVLFSASSELAVDSPGQQVVWERPQIDGLTALKIGSKNQPYVLRAGDDSRIDWGYAYIAADSNQSKGAIGSQDSLLQSFIATGAPPAEDDARQPRSVNDALPTMALAIDFGQVAGDPVIRRAMIAYDDVYAVDFFGKKLPGFWRRTPGMNGDKLLVLANSQYDDLLAKCIKFDDELMADTKAVGGDDYAYMCALAYRQSLGACGIAADANGQPLLFTKENTSNGNMATVDVIFPMDPILVFLSPTLAKASLAPVFVYAASPRWKWPNAPHDLGEYPIAFGKDDGGESMPVEESGNMLILTDAISQEEGNTKFADAWWPQLTRWAKYLEQYGLDPEEQLCTDDFKGRLAHNANLSVKAIVALAAYGDMARIHGDTATADRYMNMARADAAHWVEADGEGDHFKLAFDKPNTWGQNYNMVWDRILGLNVFPADVAKKQIEFYKTKLQPYGLPLDSRDRLTKTDWTIWTASLADNQADFEALTSPIIGYLNQTTARVPFVDSYVTDNFHSDGMHARPVIGGVFVRMLTDKAMWKKWASMDQQTVGNWAPLPLPPVVKEVIATSRKSPFVWSYTTDKPVDAWTQPGFDDSQWKKGPAGFGQGAPDSHPRTRWDTDDIWLRREIDMPAADIAKLKFISYHDEDVEIYVNGVLAGTATGFNTQYQPIDMIPEGRAALKVGKNLIAVHCHQTTGGQYIDVGISEVTEP